MAVSEGDSGAAGSGAGGRNGRIAGAAGSEIEESTMIACLEVVSWLIKTMEKLVAAGELQLLE
jgi:hypothetical protein